MNTQLIKPFLDISNLSFGYNSNEEILKDINIKIYKNDFVAILGPNGGGKSTLVKLISGLLEPSKGTIKIDGVEANLKQTTIGYVPQFLHFDKNFPIKVLDVVLMGRIRNIKIHKYSEEDYQIALVSLEMVDMIALKNNLLSELSGGQIQRVLIARALATQSDILILDEPTASVDPQGSGSIYKLVDSLSVSKTIILVTHDLSVVSNYTDKIIFINRDAKVFDDKDIPENFFSDSYGCPVDLIAHGSPHRVIDMYGNHSHNHGHNHG